MLLSGGREAVAGYSPCVAVGNRDLRRGINAASLTETAPAFNRTAAARHPRTDRLDDQGNARGVKLE
jgi:hypothetical protein